MTFDDNHFHRSYPAPTFPAYYENGINFNTVATTDTAARPVLHATASHSHEDVNSKGVVSHTRVGHVCGDDKGKDRRLNDDISLSHNLSIIDVMKDNVMYD